MMKNEFNEDIERGPKCGVRHVQVSLIFLLNFVAYSMRDSVSIAIVAMTDNSTTTNPSVPTYNWTNKNVVLSSFFWGYIIPQVFMAVVMKRYGTKRILIISMTINCIICILTPVTADTFGSYGMMACRALQGFAQAGVLPALYSVLSQWAPPAERSFLGALGGSGSLLGVIVTMPVTGFYVRPVGAGHAVFISTVLWV
ncbi:unnamed protein product [Acanthoscelides obtectus]|uniref:Major facilitator superfamily (MFS) profile domain-containing protein n=1 Tax=Acanthoscelides obtectus TaxID=200917 RepID=A0A9P0QD02_ACAOB|nr:unnamed protein product [Acanthoscelides obtectus]CAK1682743.1 Putative inorganic phosphate cotransporter [Acanthoscelides obtectus]